MAKKKKKPMGKDPLTSKSRAIHLDKKEETPRGRSGPGDTTRKGDLRRTTIWMSRRELKAVKDRAFDEEITMSEVIRAAVRDYLSL